MREERKAQAWVSLVPKTAYLGIHLTLAPPQMSRLTATCPHRACRVDQAGKDVRLGLSGSNSPTWPHAILRRSDPNTRSAPVAPPRRTCVLTRAPSRSSAGAWTGPTYVPTDPIRDDPPTAAQPLSEEPLATSGSRPLRGPCRAAILPKNTATGAWLARSTERAALHLGVLSWHSTLGPETT